MIDDGKPEFVVGQRVRFRPEGGDERAGVIVEDFGNTAGQPVDIGDAHIADAARRWAVSLDDGGLSFLDTCDLAAE